MAIFVLIFHSFIDYFLGKGVLGMKTVDNDFLYVAYALLIGIFIETMLGFILLWLGSTIMVSIISTFILVFLLNVKYLRNIKSNSSNALKSFKRFFLDFKTFTWYEWVLSLFILEKFAVIFWQLYRMPTYYSDALKHWATSGRAIYSGMNWELSRGWEFLGRKLELVLDYPLQLPIWRAVSATLNGEWNDFIARGDGLVFFSLICLLVGGIFWQLTERRWMALGAILIVASLPLQVWQAASAYVDLPVETYVVAGIIAFIRKEWWLCGLFTAGAVWSKNDGLALYLPGLLLAGFIYHFLVKGVPWVDRLKYTGQFIVGFSLVLPWLIFQAFYTDSVFTRIIDPIKQLLSDNSYNTDDYQVLLIQFGKKFESSTPSYELFWEYVFLGSSHGVFWLVMFVGILLLIKQLILDRIGRSLLAFFIVTCIIIFYIFTYTPAYEFLLIQTTIHRTMLQFSASSLVIFGYAMSLKMKELKTSKLASTELTKKA